MHLLFLEDKRKIKKSVKARMNKYVVPKKEIAQTVFI